MVATGAGGQDAIAANGTCLLGETELAVLVTSDTGLLPRRASDVSLEVGVARDSLETRRTLSRPASECAAFCHPHRNSLPLRLPLYLLFVHRSRSEGSMEHRWPSQSLIGHVAIDRQADCDRSEPEAAQSEDYER